MNRDAGEDHDAEFTGVIFTASEDFFCSLYHQDLLQSV
jgi:hypothetical protein